MFGHHDDQQQEYDDVSEQTVEGEHTPETVQPDNTSTTWQHPGTPLDDTKTAPSVDDSSVTSPSLADSDNSQDTHTDSSAPSDDPIDPIDGDPDLVDIKQQALGQLKPLVSHLDQSPEEKFRTTMMMIQASDDKSLVKTAYEAAKQITDEKTRAQALLDVINEINYFTQHTEK